MVIIINYPTAYLIFMQLQNEPIEGNISESLPTFYWVLYYLICFEGNRNVTWSCFPCDNERQLYAQVLTINLNFYVSPIFRQTLMTLQVVMIHLLLRIVWKKWKRYKKAGKIVEWFCGERAPDWGRTLTISCGFFEFFKEKVKMKVILVVFVVVNICLNAWTSAFPEGTMKLK
jgi:hypothetical protein